MNIMMKITSKFFAPLILLDCSPFSNKSFSLRADLKVEYFIQEFDIVKEPFDPENFLSGLKLKVAKGH